MNHFKDEPYVSYSQVSTYMACPLKYRFSYIEALEPEFIPAALPFGGAVHEALAFYYTGLRNYKKAYSLESVIEVFSTTWNLSNESEPVRFDKGETKESLARLGETMLKTFYENVRPGEVMAVELPFKLNLNNGVKPLPLPIVGTIDLVERDENGRVWVVDHKTASRKYSDSKTDDDLQLTIYTLAISQFKLCQGETLFHARFDLLTKTKNPEFVSYPGFY